MIVSDDLLRVGDVAAPQKVVDADPVLDPAVLAKAEAEWTTRLRKQMLATFFMGVGFYIGIELVFNGRAISGLVNLWLAPRKENAGTVPDSSAPELKLTLGIEPSEIAVVVTALVVLAATFSIAVIASDIPKHKDPVDRVNLHLWTSAATRIITVAAAISLAAALTLIPEAFGLAIVLVGTAGLTIWTAGTTQLRSADQIPALLRGYDALRRSERADSAVLDLGALFRLGCRSKFQRWWRRNAGVGVLLGLRAVFAGLLLNVLLVLDGPIFHVFSWEQIPAEIWGAWFQMIVIVILAALPAGLITIALGYVIAYQKLDVLWARIAFWFGILFVCALWGFLIWAAFQDRDPEYGVAFAIELAIVPLAVPLMPHFWATWRGHGGGLGPMKLAMWILKDERRTARDDFARTGLPASRFSTSGTTKST